ncbi:MAG TPA: alpha/beta hydrolase [Terracidiphilus sp.]|nr:alpha/beta hydrolase [Terracidiphilus sp.]
MRTPRKVVWSSGVILLLIVAAAMGFYERPVSYFDAFLDLQMHMTGAHSRWTTVDGIRIRYWVKGPDNGPPVVLVHGLGGHAEDWHNLAFYLVRDGYRLYMPDLPGFGRSGKPKDFSYSIADEANVVVGFMNAMGLKQVDLGGHSMGGWIVQHIAFEHPDRVRKLMVFDSAGIYDKPAWNTALFTPTTPGELNQLDALLMPHPPDVPAFIAHDILRISHEDAWVIQRAMQSMLTGRDTTDSELPQLKMPVLIVWGDQDHITPLADGEKMHQLIPQSQLDVVQGCGHLAPVQCADQIGPVVGSFLKR